MNTGILKDTSLMDSYSTDIDKHKELTSSLAFNVLEGLRSTNIFSDTYMRNNLMGITVALSEITKGISVPQMTGAMEALRVISKDVGVDYVRNFAPMADVFRGITQTPFIGVMESLRVSNNALLGRFTANTIESIAPIFDTYKNIDFSPMVSALQSVLKSSTVLDDFKGFRNYDFASKLNRLSDGYEVLEQSLDENVNEIDCTDDCTFKLTSDEMLEAVSVLETMLLQPKGWQDIIKEKYTSWKDSNFIIYNIVKYIFITINMIFIGVVIAVSTHSLIARHDTCLHNEDSSNAEIVATIPKDSIVTATEYTRHWYEVEYIDSATGEVYYGYAAKCNFGKNENEQAEYSESE